MRQAKAAIVPNLLQVEVRAYALPFRAPVRTSQGLFVMRRGWHVVLSDADGRQGWGDVAPWPGFGTDPQSCATALASVRRTWVRLPWPQPAAWAARLADLPVEVAYGLSLAYFDLCAQRRGSTVAAVLEKHPKTCLPVHALVHSATQAQQAVADGFSALKVKVGMGPLADEVTRIVALRAAVAPDVGLRLDANGAWSVEQAIRAARLLAMVHPEWLEQPVTATDVAGLAAVRRLGGVRIAADESLAAAADLTALLAAEAVDVVVLKPMFLGTLQTAMAVGQQARHAGLTVVVTHALESVVGRLGALHVAAALQCKVACGLQPPASADAVAGPQVHDGMMRLPGPGPCLGLGLGLGLEAPAWLTSNAS